MPITFLNADLEVTATENLEPLKEAFARQGDRFFALWVGETDPGRFLAAFEIHPEEECSGDGQEHRELTAEQRVRAFCDSISTLQGLARDLWFRATRRVIDLGYLVGDQTQAFRDGLSVDALRRMEALGIELAWTLYPPTIEPGNLPASCAGEPGST